MSGLTRAEAQTNPGDNETATGSYVLLNIGGQYKLADLHGADISVVCQRQELIR